MDFLMANRAVPIARRTQIVKRRRHYTESRFRRRGRTRRREVGMALQANKSDLLLREHPRIRRSMLFVAAPAALESYRRVFKCERPSLIAVTAETARFVGSERLHHA